MAQPLYSYLYTPESAPFYNVKKPLTQLGYITAGQRQYAEENISILHAQNITPSTGFNVTYHTMGTRGIYMNQPRAIRISRSACRTTANGIPVTPDISSIPSVCRRTAA